MVYSLTEENLYLKSYLSGTKSELTSSYGRVYARGAYLGVGLTRWVAQVLKKKWAYLRGPIRGRGGGKYGSYLFMDTLTFWLWFYYSRLKKRGGGGVLDVWNGVLMCLLGSRDYLMSEISRSQMSLFGIYYCYVTKNVFS